MESARCASVLKTGYRRRLTCRSALENASVAIAFFPLIFLDSSSTALLMSISEQPPPRTTRDSLTVCERTESAS